MYHFKILQPQLISGRLHTLGILIMVLLKFYRSVLVKSFIDELENSLENVCG